LKKNDPALYDYVDKLTDKNGDKVIFKVFVTENYDGHAGMTQFMPLKNGDIAGAEFGVDEKTFKLNGGREFAIPARAGINVINTVLYQFGNRMADLDGTLANEVGDLMGAYTEKEEYFGKDRGYNNNFSSRYSFAVESIYGQKRDGKIEKDSQIYPLTLQKGKLYGKDGKTYAY
jgi:hypothetical protein